MPAAAQAADQAAEPQKKPDLISEVPDVPKTRKGNVVISRSRRRALAGAVTQIELTPKGIHVVSGGPLDEREFKSFGAALEYARTGEVNEEEK